MGRKHQSPQWHGSLALTVLREDDRQIAFRRSFRVIWDVIPEETTDSTIVVDILFPNGMPVRQHFSLHNSHPASHLSSYTRRALADAIRKFLNFEFMHSFFHPHEDPNYTLLNWAIYGNFKDDVITKEIE